MVGRDLRSDIPGERPPDIEDVAQRDELNSALHAAAADRCCRHTMRRKIVRCNRGGGACSLHRDLDRIEQSEWRPVRRVAEQDDALDRR